MKPDFLIKLNFERSERSKDSNGTNEEFIIQNNELKYKQNNWGFKADRKEINKTIILSENEIDDLIIFIEQSSLKSSKKKKLKKDKRFSFTTYTYNLELNINKNVKFTIETNDKTIDNFLLNNINNLYNILKSKILSLDL